MPRFILVVIAAAAALAFAAPAVADPTANWTSPGWWLPDALQPAATPPVVTDPPPVDPGPTDPPPVAGCPSRPADTTPRADCPFDPSSDYYLWQGDDADAPLAYHCNYDSGYSGDPCPHDRVGDVPWYFKCVDSGLVGVEFGAAETDPVAQADVADNCGGAWYSLSVGAGGTTDPPPPAPAPVPCPSRPSGSPNPSCPPLPDGSGGYCDWDSGSPDDPCPRADADYIIVRCADGPDAGDVLHVARDTPLADVCDGGTPDVLDS